MTAFASAGIVTRPWLKILGVAVGAFLLIAGFMLAEAGASTGKRVALIVGNSAYQHAPVLANPANDATDIAVELKALGFTVIEGTDLSNRGMREKIREFANELRGADVGMLYYAGHGLQVNGRNYLAPVDARLEFESDLDFETIPLEFVQRQMEREVQTVLLFLDACRDNPLTRSFRASSRSSGPGKGLAEVKSAAGTLIAFATDPNNVALDGKGRNSPFTKAMLNNISRKDVEIQTMMTDVRREVHDETNEQQTPWINSSLLGRFYFAPASTSESASDTSQQVAALDDTATSPSTSSNSSSSAVNAAQIEALAWETVKDTKNAAELEAFIAEYGNSFYGKLARLRLRALKEETAKPAPAQTDTAATPTEPSGTTEVASLEQPKATETRKIEVQVDPRQVALGIQQELQRLSCNPGRPDGLWGRRSQGALDQFARAAKVRLVSTEPTPELLDQLRDYDGNGCPVARTCPAGQRMSSKGNCFTPQREARTEPAQPQQQSRSTRRQQQVIVEQPQPVEQQQVIIQQQPQQVIVQQPPQQVIVQQPQPRQVNPLGQFIGGAITLGVTCRLMGC